MAKQESIRHKKITLNKFQRKAYKPVKWLFDGLRQTSRTGRTRLLAILTIEEALKAGRANIYMPDHTGYPSGLHTLGSYIHDILSNLENMKYKLKIIGGHAVLTIDLESKKIYDITYNKDNGEWAIVNDNHACILELMMCLQNLKEKQ